MRMGGSEDVLFRGSCGYVDWLVVDAVRFSISGDRSVFDMIESFVIRRAEYDSGLRSWRCCGVAVGTLNQSHVTGTIGIYLR